MVHYIANVITGLTSRWNDKILCTLTDSYDDLMLLLYGRNIDGDHNTHDDSIISARVVTIISTYI